MSQIVKRGTWLYAGAVPLEVHVIKIRLPEHVPVPDDPDSEPPPTDADGYSYYVEYVAGGTRRGASDPFASAEEAIAHATETRIPPICWEDNSN